jgi:uncharacterized membrane protein
MSTILVLHIVAGLVGLVTGYIALYSAKGGPLHRKAGMLFVCAMLPMAMTGMLVAAVEGVAPAINIPAAAVTFYMVVTALTTVRPPARGSKRLDFAGMLFGFAVGFCCFVFAVSLIGRGGRQAGMAFPLFIFGIVALSGGAGDRRMINAGGIHGAARLRRHLWRMCFALFVAAGSFFLGQADEFPEPLRITPLLAFPVLAVLATMVYWLRRLRTRANHRDGVHITAREAI